MRHRARSLLAVAALAVAALIPSTAAAAPDPGWIRWLGPTGDDAEAWVRVFGSSATTMYAGTEGLGMFRSTDNGVTWSRFSTGLATAGALALRDIDAGPTKVTISTDGGLFTSTSGGAWQPLGQGVGADKLNANVQTLYSRPLPGSPLLAGVVGGVRKSSDGGETWTPSSTGMPASTTVWSLDSFTWLPGYILAATSAGAYRSLDNGSSWAPVTDGLPSGTNILKIVSDPQSPLTWYAITSGEGVFRSTTGGVTWGPVNNGLGADIQVRAIALLPVAPAYSDVIIGTQNGLYASLDKGVSWKKISNTGPLGGLDPHTITWAITTLPNLPLALLAGTQGGGVSYRLMTPPINTAAPLLGNGAPNVGESISGTIGTWEGTDTKAYSFQWQRCLADGSGCVDIADETNQTYTLVAADQGKRVRIMVKAENAASPPGYTSTPAGQEPSAVSAIVLAAPGSLPGASTKPNPSITPSFGTISVGDVLTASTPAWSPLASSGYAYRWYRCSELGLGCTPVTGVGSSNYTLVAADADHRMAVEAFGTNPNGTSQSDLTVMSSTILPQQVTKTSDPAVAGQPWIGQTLVRSTGSYSGLASTFTSWQVCDTAQGTGCNGIAGTGDDVAFTPNAAQLGKFIRVSVEVDVNGFNQFPPKLVETSAAIGPVTAAPALVANTAAPTLAGRAVSSVLLTLNRGTWAGGPTLTQTWLRCTGAGTGCSPIAGATGTTYRLAAADVGKRVLARVRGVNAWALPVLAQTAPTAVVAASLKPVYGSGARITGTARVGRKLTARRGTWAAVPSAIAYRYQWTRNGKRIAGATKATYRLRAADRRKRIGCTVTARNAAGATVRKLAARRVA